MIEWSMLLGLGLTAGTFSPRKWIVRVLFVSLLVVAMGAAALGLWYWSVKRRFVEGAQNALNGLVAAPVPQHLVFRNVAMWDGRSDHARSRVSVEVRDGLVVAIRKTDESAPAGALVVEGVGKTLIPGLIDAHVHMMFDSGPDLLTRRPALMREWMDVATRYPKGRDDIVRRGQFKLKAGVTTMRVLGDGYYALAYRDDVARWNVVGPRVLAAGLHVNGPQGYVRGGIAASNSNRRSAPRPRWSLGASRRSDPHWSGTSRAESMS